MHAVSFNGRNISPSKVVCIGRNYTLHIEELGNELPETMVVFNKPNSAVTSELRFFGDACRFEGEICFLIENGQIAGIGFGLDLTRADIQNRLKAKGLPWERAKAFDGSAVLGRFVPLNAPVETLRMTLHVDGKLQQHADYSLMIYKPETMLEEIKNFMTLENGDVIMSGTPKGVSSYTVGQTFIGRVYSDDLLLVETSWTVRDGKSGEAE